MKIKKLGWDSEFFGFEVGELNTSTAFLNTEHQNFDLIYIKQNEDLDLSIVGYEKTFQETKIIFTKSLADKNVIHLDLIDFDEKPIKNEKLYELAYLSGNYSRFLLDHQFGKEKFKNLYRTWIDNSINKKFADKIFYTIHDNKISGFVTLQTRCEYASIGLIAVDPAFQGKGIGGILISICEHYCFLKNFKELRIPTQEENIGACNFYKKIGYSVMEKTFIKHYWKNI